MKLTRSDIRDGLDYVRRTIASLEAVDLEDLANDAAFREQYIDTALDLLKIMVALDQAKLTDDQRVTLEALVRRRDRRAIALARDVIAYWSTQAARPHALN